jgi:omega-hydroxy-beta-dihydromenaquinone-9 sulfotransferase
MKNHAKELADAVFRMVFPLSEKLLALAYDKKASNTPINRPIVVIGPDRSGTTLVYALLANHPDVSGLTAMADRFPNYPFSSTLVRKIFSARSVERYRAVPDTVGGIEGGWFTLNECNQYWRRHLGTKSGGWLEAGDDFFTENDLDEATRQMLPLDLKRRMAVLGRNRLVIKQPGFSLKLRYLNALFPDAIFVHCHRNPFDNYHSLMNQKNKSGNENWGVRIPEKLQLPGASVEARTARQLAATYDIIKQDIEQLDNGAKRYVCVSYEAFQDSYATEVQKLFQGCGLEAPSDIVKHPEIYFRSSSRHNPQQFMVMDSKARQILEALGERMGYKNGNHSTILSRPT